MHRRGELRDLGLHELDAHCSRATGRVPTSLVSLASRLHDARVAKKKAAPRRRPTKADAAEPAARASRFPRLRPSDAAPEASIVHGETSLVIGLVDYLRVVVLTLLFGGGLGGLALYGVIEVVVHRHDLIHADREMLSSLLLSAVLVASVLLPILCLRLRTGGAVRVTCDEEGVTEWEGDAVRTFIPRAGSRVATSIATARRHGRVHRRCAIAQISDEHGRRITLGAETLGASLGLFGLPLWMRRSAHRCNFAGFDAILRALPVPDAYLEVVPDARAARRPSVWRAATFVGLVAGSYGFYLLANRHGLRDPIALTLLISGACAMLAALRPLAENRAIAREGAVLANARRASFRARPDGSIHLALRDGGEVVADVGAVRHPDARALQRGVPVLVVLTESGGSDDGGYRAAPRRVIVHALATPEDRAEHARLTRANRIEIAARLGHAALVLSNAALALVLL
ncbi:MAG: hypothetical protein M3Y87_27120 [Myxococcota bacterium]|nr:hypothetical protein [Myxococcota bacterium]